MIGDCSLKINNIIREKSEKNQRENEPTWFYDSTLLFDAVPHLKQCSILSCKPRDNAIIEKFLQDHTTSEVCYFHAQQQVFIEAIRQEKQEEQETIQQMFVAAKISTSQVEENKQEDVKK